MLKAIFFKELYKIRKLWLLLFLANLALSLQFLVTTRRLFLFDHSEIIWYRVMQLGQLYCEQLRYLPLVAGIIVGLVQFLPEMNGERLRLGLHLPVSPQRLLFSHLAAGFLAFVIALLPNIVMLLGASLYWFPVQWLVTLFFTTFPWFLAGITAYLGTALVLLEPGTRLKACNLLLTAGICKWFLIRITPGAYQPAAMILLIPLLLMLFAVLHPAYHFRTRRTA